MKVLFCLFLIPASLVAQTTDDPVTETIAANQLQSSESEDETPGTSENYAQYIVHLADLNSATAEQLRLLGLTELQVKNLATHRARHGNLASIYELQTIDGFDTTSIRTLKRMAAIKDPTSKLDRHFFQRIKTEGYTYALFRSDFSFQKKKGFSNTVSKDQEFQGGQNRYSFRFRSFRAGDFSLGITAENDPGEKFKWEPSRSRFGFDYIAIHAQVQNKGLIRNLIVGHYQAQFGQGLVWGGGIGFGKGSESVVNARRSNIGFLPYTSAFESGAFHGLATTLAVKKNLSVNIMFSSSKKDATLGFQDNRRMISSFQTSGLHRNRSELEKRKVIAYNAAGLGLEYNRHDLTVGSTFQITHLNYPLEPKQSPYNQFAFRGQQNTNAGFYLNYFIHNVSFFSEAATTLHHGSAFVFGSLISLTTKFDLSWLYRSYARNYIAPFANAFSEGTLPINERGFYWGWKYKPNRRYYISGYLDFFHFPWLKYRTYAPIAGHEWLIHFHWQPVRTTSIFFQARQEDKQRNSTLTELPNYTLDQIRKRSYWLHAEYYLVPAIRMKSRIQWSTFNNGHAITEGFAFAQDFAVTVGKVKFTLRYALFDTDDYDNRQYMYENDVWLAYSLPPYYGKGVRKYALFQYKLNKTVTVWVRYSQTRFLSRESIGSGLDTIDGDKQNDIKFELRIHL